MSLMAKLRLSMKKAGFHSKLHKKYFSPQQRLLWPLPLCVCVLRELEISAVAFLFSNDQVGPQLI